MPFSESVKDQAFARSAGRCECTRLHAGLWHAPHHGGRCQVNFTRQAGWHAHHRVTRGRRSDTVANCEALCDRCHELAR